MTKKRFFKLRLALVTRINEYYKGTDIENHEIGKGLRTLRDYNPVLNGDRTTYAECWSNIRMLCDVIGMKVRD